MHLIDDFHSHLRQDDLLRTISSHLPSSGVRTVLVMPNTIPPIKSTSDAISYRRKLIALEPSIQYLMTLYLSPELTPQEIVLAHKNGIFGVKSYPRGVTTNSEEGICEDYEMYFDIFRVMEEYGLVLHLHGEVPSGGDVCILNAEEKFLKYLHLIAINFPNLKIVLEHATTRSAVDMVCSLGDNVGCTITLHHLDLIIDDWATNRHNYCKPVAKYPSDREALRSIVRQGHPRFFFGSDSAPHTKRSKSESRCCAGVYSGRYLLQGLASVMEEFGALERMEKFACVFGREFFGVERMERAMRAQLEEIDEVHHRGLLIERQECEIELVREEIRVPDVLPVEGGEDEIVPFKAGEVMKWGYREKVVKK